MQYGLLVIEVKSDKIPMNDRILQQALDYRDILQCDYVGIANSPTLSDFQLFQVNEDGEILEIDGIPSYQELLAKVNITYLPPLEPLQRLPYEGMLSPDYWKTLHDEEGAIGEDTPLALKPFVAELYNFIQAELACKNLPIQCGHISINEDI